MTTTSILFICMGNICRSPTAECLFRSVAERRGHADRFEVDSAGTGGWHVGQEPDARMREAGRRAGVAIEGVARQVTVKDFERFDLVLCADKENHGDLLAMGARPDATHLLLEYAGVAGVSEVPDPYYGGETGFDVVVELLTTAAEGLVDRFG